MSHDADVLNRLIAQLRGASAGYRKAGADGPGLSDVFGAAAGAHDGTAESLASVVHALGGEAGPAPVADASPHAWTALPHAVAQGPRALSEAIERAEAELLQAFRSAMDDTAVSGPIRDAVMRAFDGVKAGRDRALQRLNELEG